MGINSKTTWGSAGQFSKQTTIKKFLSTTRPVSNGCILWTGAIGSRGRYGSVSAMGKPWLAHRLAWTLFRGDIPNGIFVLHKCDVGICVNPKHLFLGTQRDNVLDMEGKRRSVHPRGESNGQSKLSLRQVNEARVANQKGESQASIARRFLVTAGTISHIINGRSWKRDL